MEEFIKLSPIHVEFCVEGLADHDKRYIVTFLHKFMINMNSYNQIKDMPHAKVESWLNISKVISIRIIKHMVSVGMLVKIPKTRSGYMANPQIFNRQNSNSYGKLLGIYKSNSGKLVVLPSKFESKYDDYELEKLVKKSYEEATLKSLRRQGIKVNTMIDVAKMCKTNMELTNQVKMLIKRLDEKLTFEEKKQLHKDLKVVELDAFR